MKNVERELELMTTAWYSLNSRLQMPNVTVQRRSDSPRSWLNKQRRLMGQATAGSSPIPTATMREPTRAASISAAS